MTPAEGLFQFLAQERVGWGTPAPQAIAREMAALGAQRALIVASTTIATRTDAITAIEAELGEAESTKLIWKPTTTTELDLDGAQKLMRLIEVLEDDDDVQRVTANFEVSDEVMAQLA